MAITALPTPPTRSDPSTFAARGDAFMSALPTFATEANTLATDVGTLQSTASTAATTATTQAGIATTQAGNAATSAGTATTQAGNASTSASTATTQAGIATTKAGEANASAIAAAASAASVGFTLSSVSTLTNKTLTTPVINGFTGTGNGTVTGNFTTTGNAALGDAEATDTHAIKGATTVLANSASAALTVTQTGAGNAFVVEDSASTDSTPFVVSNIGVVISGHTLQLAGSVYNPTFQHVGVDSGIGFSAFVYSADTSRAVSQFNKSRHATVGLHAVVNSGDPLGQLQFAGSDGTNFIRAALISAEVDSTPGTNDMPGRLVFSTTADGASSPSERMRIDSAGNVGIGGTPTLGYSVWNAKALTGGTTAVGQINIGVIQSNVTSVASMFFSQPATAAAAFTLTSLRHYATYQSTIGAGSAVTNQTGFDAHSSLTGATNNYGFYSSIAAGTNRYNFYAAGTADNYFAGRVGVGGVPAATTQLFVSGSATGDVNNYGVYNDIAIQSDVTTSAGYFTTSASTAAAVFTLANLRHYLGSQATFGAGSTVTNQQGFLASSNLTGATNNYGFYSSIAAGTNRYNFYAAGTAQNYFAGATGIGIAPAATSNLTVAAGTTSVSSLNIPHGAAPSAPVNGDVWSTTAGLFIRINGVTKTVTLT